MENEEHAGGDGMAGSFRRAGTALLRTLRNRAELLGLELEEEGHWVVGAFVWTSAAIFFTVLTVTVITITVVMAVPESAQLWVMVGFSALYLILAISAVARLRKHFRSRRPPLADTVSEIKKDLEWIQSQE